MVPIYRLVGIHIDITNGCNLQCSNCTRHIGHHANPYMMDLDTVEKAILSLVTPFNAGWQNFEKGFPGIIGIMGGEPTAHPKLPEILELVRKYIPREKRQFWTDGFRYDRFKSSIEETFDLAKIHINRHDDGSIGWHQPLLIAPEEIIEDKGLRERLIGDCWVQGRWFGSITPRGGFPCETMASLSHTLDGPLGYTIEPGWWAKDANDFWDMREAHCNKCSAAIPLPAVMANNRDPHCDFDLVSPGNLKRLLELKSPRALAGKVVVFDERLDEKTINEYRKNWKPWRHDPSQVYGAGEKEFNQYRPSVFKKDDNGLVQITTI